jgi:hypothetical protein
VACVSHLDLKVAFLSWDTELWRGRLHNAYPGILWRPSRFVPGWLRPRAHAAGSYSLNPSSSYSAVTCDFRVGRRLDSFGFERGCLENSGARSIT